MKMIDPHDYSKTIFSEGLVCYNKNNNNYCVVINGRKGSENDRSSLVMEFFGEEGFILHTPPNRALVPTGKVVSLKHLATVLRANIVVER